MSKMSLNTLSANLAAKSGLSQMEAELFIRKMFEVCNHGLETDKLVKMKWLGTFKVSAVKDRESVDVNTGERIVIEGRDKISFTPDNILKEIVNKPFAQFETVVVNDGVDFDSIDEKYQSGSLSASSEDNDVSSDVAKESSAGEELVAEEGVTADEKPEKSEKLEKPEELEKGENTGEKRVNIEESTAASSEEIPAADIEEIPAASIEEFPTASIEVTSAASVEKTSAINAEETPAASIQETPTISTEETSVAKEISPAHIEEEVKEEIKEVKEEVKGEVREAVKGEVKEAVKGEVKEEVKEEVEEEIRHSHFLLPKYLVVAACFIILALIGGTGWLAFNYGQMAAQRNHLALQLDQYKAEKSAAQKAAAMAQNADSQEQILKQKAYEDSIRMAQASDAIEAAELAERKDSIEQAEKLRGEVKASQKNALKNTQKNLQASQKNVIKNAQENAAKIAEDKAKAEAKKLGNKKSLTNYDSDVRVRTGAYRIVGVAQTVTASAGQSMVEISKKYLGPGMECYVEALNGTSTVKSGQKIKIPKLEIKRKRK